MILHQNKKLKHLKESERSLYPIYTRAGLEKPAPKYELPKNEMDADTAYNLIHDELILDGNSRLNLATFVSTWMDPQARTLMSETFDKNMIDKDEYPQTAELEMRCVNILAKLWNAPDSENTIGTSTIGSSEACMLGGMALKWNWRNRRKKEGKDTSRPNMVMGVDVQVCWDKFCRYWDVEPRLVPMKGDRYMMDPEDMIKLCDENTIGVVGVMGTTFTGQYEPIEKMNSALERLNKKTGWDIGIHVDGASGGFIAPFIQPKLKWDFRLKWVKSINTSGHKYGLVFPGVGWVVWRDKESLPEELIFNVNYLGGQMPTFAINFSRPGSQIVAQYYNFLRLGFDGYKRTQQTAQDVAMYLSGQISKMGPFKLVSDGSDIPVFAFTLKHPEEESYSLYDLTDRLRMKGWLIPAYSMPKNRADLVVARIVVKRGFSMDLAENLLEEMRRILEYFKTHSHVKTKSGTSFNHT